MYNFLLYFISVNIYYIQNIGDWGLGIGDWGLGIGPNPQSPFIKKRKSDLFYLIILSYNKLKFK